jgi:hypothetical protein
MGNNKKWVGLPSWSGESYKKKKKNHDRDIDKLNVRVTEFIMMRVWFVTKWGGEGCCFLKEEKK